MVRPRAKEKTKMNNLNCVCLIGKVTREPKLRTLPKGNKVAEVGIGIPESHKDEKGQWQSKMHFVDVTLWEGLADYAAEKLKKGDGVLVQGQLVYEQWTGKDGKPQSKLKVRGQRVQQLAVPDRAAVA